MSTQDDRDKAILLWTLGLSTSAIAERLGRGMTTIQKWVKDAGARKPGEPPRQRYDSIGGSSGHRKIARLTQ